MKTLQEILSDIPQPSAQRYAKALADVRLIQPHSQGDGLPFLYSETDAETLSEFARLRRQEKLSIENTLKSLESRRINAPQSTTSDAIEAHRGALMPFEAVEETAPDDRAQLEARLADLENRTRAAEKARSESELRRLETERLAREAESAARIAAERAETAIREAESEREARRLAAEETRNHRARISRLETSIKQGRPQGLRARIRAALDVLFGNAAAVPALPESIEYYEERRAA